MQDIIDIDELADVVAILGKELGVKRCIEVYMQLYCNYEYKIWENRGGQIGININSNKVR